MAVTFASVPITGPQPTQDKTATQNPVTDIRAANDVKTQDAVLKQLWPVLAPCAQLRPYVK